MTVVPLPDKPCVRVRLIYNEGAVGESGNRFYISYAGSAPSGGNCASLATSIQGFWSSHLAPQISNAFALEEVDVLDIATDSGLSGQWTGSDPGQATGTGPPANVATNVEFGIARRYRGGKPRFYLPPGDNGDILSLSSWTGQFVTNTTAAVTAFFAAIEALAVGSMGTLQHVNLSYYSGFKNVANSSGRERAVPQYRATALSDPIVGYSCKAIVGSQRRRRTSSTP